MDRSHILLLKYWKGICNHRYETTLIAGVGFAARNEEPIGE
jgi:hypothetical protein